MKQAISLELNSLLQIIHGLNSIEGFQHPDFDLNRFQQLIKYHGIQALVFEQDQKNRFLPENVRHELTQFMQQQVIFNLRYTAESNRLLALFATYNIPILILKGNLFIKRIYQNKLLRSSSDLDVLVQKKHVNKSLEILLQDGYRIQSANHSGYDKLPEELQNLISQESLHHEIHIEKGIFNVDFHWDIFQYFFYQKYQERKPLIEEIFQQTELIDSNGFKTHQLTNEGIFWTLLAHHGAKESWFRLRHLQDLHAFLIQFGSSLNWESILPKLETYRLSPAFNNALYLLKNHFHYSLPFKLENELINFDSQGIVTIINQWERGIYWSKNRRETLRYWWLLGKMQDQQFNYISYMLAYLKYFLNIKKQESYPNKFGFYQLPAALLKLFLRLIQKK
ncbi:nucleotidyltransferase family protein [Aquirufa aurantiipilula]|uniref:Nucleotidyltransferase family protein n=1 Tax=Aquirufa aurantiipilula TaxID=2696561 RepID=A0ABT6BM49_9BACT|nr:nucleotidyltransferase family protein [Aquirufa aurantiipilula]MDF5691004.1 nucleotidyltransferase family protein [Aquirufa aurantiipilula]